MCSSFIPRLQSFELSCSPTLYGTHACYTQDINGWLFHAARCPTKQGCLKILEQKMKPTKPAAFESLMKKPLRLWAHCGQPPNTVIMDQTTTNGAESTMNMIGKQVRAQSQAPNRSNLFNLCSVAPKYPSTVLCLSCVLMCWWGFRPRQCVICFVWGKAGGYVA